MEGKKFACLRLVLFNTLQDKDKNAHMFETTILITIPVFGTMLTGYILARSRVIADGAVDVLNRLVYYAAFPALLFSFLAKTPIHYIWQVHFLETWLLSLLGIYMLTFLISRVFWRSDRTVSYVRSMTCTCGNTAWIGIPLLINVFGNEGALPAILATIVIVTVFFGLTLALIESAKDGVAGSGRALVAILRSLSRNPLIIAVALGAFCAAYVDVPKPVLKLGEVIGSAAVPCSLMTIGIFLANQAGKNRMEGTIGPTLIKIVVHPLLVWAIVHWAIPLEPTMAAAAILLAALPSATSCFTIAKEHDILVAETAGTVWLSTLLSIASIVTVLFLYGLGA